MPETGRVAAEELLYLSRDPLNAETPLERQVGVVTPASRHYVRDHFAIPRAPERLAIDGAVRAFRDSPVFLVVDHPAERARAELSRQAKAALLEDLEPGQA